MIEFLFLDLDDTILDFRKAERLALSKTLRDFGAEPTDAVLNRYHEINIWHWQQMEKNRMTREEVLVGRYQMLFSELEMDIDPLSVTRAYEKNLSVGHYFLPGAEDALKTLQGKYRLFLASNGTASVQHSRLTSAGLYPYFEGIFISQEIGFNKPSGEYFDACFAQIPDFNPQRAMMVGDSLTSDIRGGLRAGMKTCWINPERKPGREDILPDYVIESIAQLDDLLEDISCISCRQSPFCPRRTG